MNKYTGPHGAPCAGCGAYLTMRTTAQRAAATTHRANCTAYAAFKVTRTA